MKNNNVPNDCQSCYAKKESIKNADKQQNNTFVSYFHIQSKISLFFNSKLLQEPKRVKTDYCAVFMPVLHDKKHTQYVVSSQIS